MRYWLKVLLLMLIADQAAVAQVVSTIAGSVGNAGYADGQGSAALFSAPNGIASDKNGNIYIADRLNNRIRKINTSGIVSTAAGTGSAGAVDGPALSASFYEPSAVACDTSGNVYIADTKNYKIRKLDPAGNVTTVAGIGVFGTTNGPAAVARFGFPAGLCVTPSGNTIYVADYNTHVIRRIYNDTVITLTGIIYTAGSDDGPVGTATLNHPHGIELDANGNIIVADEWSNKIRIVNPAGYVYTIAGTGTAGSADGTAASASFNSPVDIACDNGSVIYITDALNNTIRKLDPASSVVSTYAGAPGSPGSIDGNGNVARFNGPSGMGCIPGSKTLFIADEANQTIRKISAISPVQLTLNAAASYCYGDSIVINPLPANLSNYIYYEGSTVIGTAASGQAHLAPLPQGNHTITCTATDASGLTAYSSPVTITVLAPVVATISAPQGTTFCQGDSVMLTASSGSSFLWSNGMTSQSVYATATGAYTVTVTASNGCSAASAPVNCTATTAFIPTITAASDTICPGDSVQLSASAGSSWLWSNGASGQYIYVHPGSYSVTVSDGSGCTSTSAVTVIYNYPNSVATVTPQGPVTAVQGSAITLSSSPGNSYLWSTGASTQNISVTANGNYTVTVTSPEGCVTTSTAVQVLFITPQQMISSTGAVTFCEGGSVTLESYFQQNIQWYYNGLAIPNENSQQLTAGDSGYYQVAVLQNGSWYFSDSIYINILPVPAPALVNDTMICSGTSVTLMAQSAPLTSVLWFDQDTAGIMLGQGNVYQTPPITQLTSFYIEVTGSNGCHSERVQLNVTVKPTPQADFDYVITDNSGSFTVSLNNLSGAADGYYWFIPDSATPLNQYEADLTFSNTGSYDVTLVAANANGCSDTLMKTIVVKASHDWYIPNTFTPDNDGHNDVFRVRGQDVLTKDMKIYDQWGKLVFTSGHGSVWDGSSNGEQVQNGTYLYEIRLEKADTESLVTGTITLIR
jgi:gliding motility-associated-like protein